MRALAAVLRARADAAGALAARCTSSYEHAVFEGPAAQRIDDRVSRVGTDVADAAVKLRDLADRLATGATRVEDAQRREHQRQEQARQRQAAEHKS